MVETLAFLSPSKKRERVGGKKRIYTDHQLYAKTDVILNKKDNIPILVDSQSSKKENQQFF